MKQNPCHYNRPFVDRNGTVFPCCFLNREPKFAIGNIADSDIGSKMEHYNINCSCSLTSFRPKNNTDRMRTLYIQCSLKCHGSCAVCYVGAPQKRDPIEIDYEEALRLAKLLNPQIIALEGGEIPILPKAMDFARILKQEMPETAIRLITNGCYDQRKALEIASIFDEITVSFMGFTPSIHHAETGLDVNKTKVLARIAHENGVFLRFRFICTPMTLPDAGNFLEWATTFPGAIPFIDDCRVDTYVDIEKNPQYWPQTIARCRDMLIKTMMRRKQAMKDNGNILQILPKAAKTLGLRPELKEKLHLENVVIH